MPPPARTSPHESRVERFAPLSGVVAVALGLAAYMLWGKQPGSDASASEVARYFNEHHSAIQVGSYVDALSAPFFIWFAALFCRRLRNFEPSGFLSLAAFGGLLVTMAAFLVHDGLLYAGATRASGDGDALSADEAAALYDLSRALVSVSAPMGLATLFGATALVSLRYRALPRALGWAAAVLTVLVLIPPLSFIGATGSLVWLLITSIYLYRTGTDGPAEAVAGAR